jgi:hypothetical protein
MKYSKSGKWAEEYEIILHKPHTYISQNYKIMG